ncbi:androglobin [Mustelus asterias]
MAKVGKKRVDSTLKASPSPVQQVTVKDTASFVLSCGGTGGITESRKGRFPLWPEWNEADINAEKWDLTKPIKEKEKNVKSPSLALFDDPEGKIELPPSLKVHTWKRPFEFIMEKVSLICTVSVSFDLMTTNEHIMESELMRWIISEVIMLWVTCQDTKLNEKSLLDSSGPPWKPWEHVYALCKAMKGHIALYNSYGKYVVRLYWMGCWRKITVDDTMPFDKNDKLLLPSTACHGELWPMLLSKALIKLASIDMNTTGRKEVGEFTVLHALTGWHPEIVPLQSEQPERMWSFLKTMVPEFTFVNEEPVLAKAPSVESIDKIIKEHEEIAESASFKPVEKAAKGLPTPMMPQMLMYATYLPLQLSDKKISLLGQMAESSEKLRHYGLSHVHSHPVLVTRTRSCPLVDPPEVIQIPRWKLIRPRNRALPIADPKEPKVAKPDQFVEISSPLLDYKIGTTNMPPARKDQQLLVKKDMTTRLAAVNETEETLDEDDEVDLKSLEATFSAGESQIETIKSDVHFSVDGDVTKQQIGESLEEEPMYVRPPLESLIEDSTFSFPNGSPLFSQMSNAALNMDNITEPTSPLQQKIYCIEKWIDYEDFSTKYHTKCMIKSKLLRKSEMKQIWYSTKINSMTMIKPTDDRGPYYLHVDNTKPIEMLITFSALVRWGDISCEKSLNKGNNDKDNLKELSSLLPGMLIAERYSWKSLATIPPILCIKTVATKSTILELPCGRHVIRFTTTCPLGHNINISSTVPFTFGDEDTVLATLSKDSLRFNRHAARIMKYIENAIHSFNDKQEFHKATKELLHSHFPCEFEDKSLIDKQIKTSDASLHVPFLAIRARQEALFHEDGIRRPSHQIKVAWMEEAEEVSNRVVTCQTWVQYRKLFNDLLRCARDKQTHNSKEWRHTKRGVPNLRLLTTAKEEEMEITGLGEVRLVADIEVGPARNKKGEAAIPVVAYGHTGWKMWGTQAVMIPNATLFVFHYGSLSKNLAVALKEHEDSNSGTQKLVPQRMQCDLPIINLSQHSCTYHQQLAFNTAVYATVAHALDACPTIQECFALKTLLIDTSPKKLVIKNKSCSIAATELPEAWKDRSPTKDENLAANKLQIWWRGVILRELKNARTIGSEQHEYVHDILREMWDVLEADVEQNALFLLRYMFDTSPELAKLYPFYEDEWSKTVHADYTTTYSDQPSNFWFVVFREVFYMPEDMLMVPKIYSVLPACVLHVINNDTGEEMPRVFQKVAPTMYSKNAGGYTFMAEGQTGSLPVPAGKWKLRLIGSRHPLPVLASDTVSSSFSMKEIKFYYIPNDKNIIFRFQINLHATHLATLHLQTSKPDVYIKLQILDNDEEVAKATGKGHAVIPSFLFISSAGRPMVYRGGSRKLGSTSSTKTARSSAKAMSEPKSPVFLDEGLSQLTDMEQSHTKVVHKYVIQALVLHKSWPLTESELAFAESQKDVDNIELAGRTIDPAFPETEESKPSTAAKHSRKGKGADKDKGKEKSASTKPEILVQQIDITKPHFTLHYVTDYGESDCAEIKKDTERQDEILAMKRAWEAAEPGRAFKALQLRLHVMNYKAIDSAFLSGKEDENISEVTSEGELGDVGKEQRQKSSKRSPQCQEDGDPFVLPKHFVPTIGTNDTLHSFMGSGTTRPIPILVDETVIEEQGKSKAEEIHRFRQIREAVLQKREVERQTRCQLKAQQLKMYEDLQVALDDARDKIYLLREAYRTKLIEEELKQQEIAAMEAALQAEQERKLMSSMTKASKSSGKKK